MNDKEPHPQPWTTFLCTWYSASRGDHFTTTADSPHFKPYIENPAEAEQLPEIGTIKDANNKYELVRVEGRIFSSGCPQPPNTVPLYSYWDGASKNNILTTATSIAGNPELKSYRLEGYIYKNPASEPIALKAPKGEKVHDPLPRRELRIHHNSRQRDDLTTSATGNELGFLVGDLPGNYEAGALLGFLLPDIDETIPLNTWHCSGTKDYYTNALWVGSAGDTEKLPYALNEPALVYELVHSAGKVYNPHFPQPEGTLPLWSFWNSTQRKHLLTTRPDWIRAKGHDGYERSRLEGFVLDSQRWEALPLISYHSQEANGSAAVVSRPDEPPVLTSGWMKDRTEGYVFRTGETVNLDDITDPLLPTNLVEGDREFGGHGPALLARLRLHNTESEVKATISFEAWEYPFGGPHDTPRRKSHTLQAWEKTVFKAPAGRKILAITSATTSEVLFESLPGGFQVLVTHQEYVKIADLLSNISEVVNTAIQLGGSERAKAISAASDATFRLFADGFKVVPYKGEKVQVVMPRYAGPVCCFAIVGDTGGIDIARHDNPHGNTRIAGISMAACDVVMD